MVRAAVYSPIHRAASICAQSHHIRCIAAEQVKRFIAHIPNPLPIILVELHSQSRKLAKTDLDAPPPPTKLCALPKGAEVPEEGRSGPGADIANGGPSMIVRRFLLHTALMLLVLFVPISSGAPLPVVLNTGSTIAPGLATIAYEQCLPPTACGGGPKCVPAPTSLTPVDPTGNVSSGWESAGGHCGWKRCWGFFYTPCGKPLASGACN